MWPPRKVDGASCAAGGEEGAAPRAQAGPLRRPHIPPPPPPPPSVWATCVAAGHLLVSVKLLHGTFPLPPTHPHPTPSFRPQCWTHLHLMWRSARAERGGGEGGRGLEAHLRVGLHVLDIVLGNEAGLEKPTVNEAASRPAACWRTACADQPLPPTCCPLGRPPVLLLPHLLACTSLLLMAARTGRSHPAVLLLRCRPLQPNVSINTRQLQSHARTRANYCP